MDYSYHYLLLFASCPAFPLLKLMITCAACLPRARRGLCLEGFRLLFNRSCKTEMHTFRYTRHCCVLLFASCPAFPLLKQLMITCATCLPRARRGLCLEGFRLLFNRSCKTEMHTFRYTRHCCVLLFASCPAFPLLKQLMITCAACLPKARRGLCLEGFRLLFNRSCKTEMHTFRYTSHCCLLLFASRPTFPLLTTNLMITCAACLPRARRGLCLEGFRLLFNRSYNVEDRNAYFQVY